MKKEAILDSLLNNAEKIDSHVSYVENIDFMLSFAVLKINPPGYRVDPEYELYKNSNVVTFKRTHAYILNEGGKDMLYLFKNSVPDKSIYISDGEDYNLFSENFKDKLIYTVGLFDRKKADPTSSFFKCYKIILNDSLNAKDLDEKREYIIKNIRTNVDGQTVCWHIYPAIENENKVLNILEHNNPNNLKLAKLAENEETGDTHYIPVEKDRKNWKKYINP